MADELADPYFRLRNLYMCREEGTGRALKFVLRPEQELLLKYFIEEPHVPVYVIKSRRLGISTFCDTYMLDCAIHRQGYTGFIIDQKQDDSVRKMVNIVRFAYDNLPPEIRQYYVQSKRNDSEMRQRLITEDESKESTIYATTGGRGGDCSMLHVSEWGPIAATDPTRSEEIRSGAFPAARRGLRVVETTWYGGKSGDLYDLVKPILDGNPNAEGRILFFPWHADPTAVKVTGEITKQTEDYFKELSAKLNKSFDREQKLWYAAKKVEQGRNMNREYPSTLTEAMSVPVPGAIYDEEMTELKEQKRMCVFNAERNLPAYTFWDIGVSDYGCIWLVQFSGRDILLLDYHSMEGEGAAYFVKWIREAEATHGVSVRTNFLPHDAKQRAKGSGQPFTSDVIAAGIPEAHIRIVPRTPDIWLGINALRALFGRIWIHATNCTREIKTSMGADIPTGAQCLEFYRKKVVNVGGTVMFEDPVHDIYSHGASALRTMSEAHRQGMLEGASSVERETRVVSRQVLRGASPASYNTPATPAPIMRRVLR
jgi:hypothetical protein